MKKSVIFMVILIGLCLSTLIGCDPVYPSGELEVNKVEPISIGDSIDIEIIYPNTEDSAVTGWKNQNVEIISGRDIVSGSGLTLTGIKSGTARVKVNATTIITYLGVELEEDERVYSKEVDIRVK